MTPCQPPLKKLTEVRMQQFSFLTTSALDDGDMKSAVQLPADSCTKGPASAGKSTATHSYWSPMVPPEVEFSQAAPAAVAQAAVRHHLPGPDQAGKGKELAGGCLSSMPIVLAQAPQAEQLWWCDTSTEVPVLRPSAPSSLTPVV